MILGCWIWTRETWVQFPVQPQTSTVTLGKSINLSRVLVFHLYNDGIHCYFTGYFFISKQIIASSKSISCLNTLGRKISEFVTAETEVVFHRIIIHRKSQNSPLYLISLSWCLSQIFPNKVSAGFKFFGSYSQTWTSIGWMFWFQYVLLEAYEEATEITSFFHTGYHTVSMYVSWYC